MPKNAYRNEFLFWANKKPNDSKDSAISNNPGEFSFDATGRSPLSILFGSAWYRTVDR